MNSFKHRSHPLIRISAVNNCYCTAPGIFLLHNAFTWYAGQIDTNLAQVGHNITIYGRSFTRTVDDLAPELPRRYVVNDLYVTHPTQETRHRSCRLSGSQPSTRDRPYTSGIYYCCIYPEISRSSSGNRLRLSVRGFHFPNCS